MPLDSVPSTVDLGALDAKKRAAAGKCHVDVGFWGGVVPDNLGELEQLWSAGVCGFKCFLVDSGSKDFPRVDLASLESALSLVGRLGGPLLVHAESNEVAEGLPSVSTTKYAEYLATRPRGLENLAIAQLIEAARRSGGRAHVAHLSSSDALWMIESARREGVRVTGETCPHYLTFSSEEISDGDTRFKCAPPIREEANRELLWQGLRGGVLDLVVSDHSPSPASMKTRVEGDFGSAWSGISSLQLALSIVWSGARTRGFSLADVVRWMSEQPAALAGLCSKGGIAVGKDADFCIFAPDEEFIVDPAKLQHRNSGTPYDGRRLTGVIRDTMLHGELVDLAAAPAGNLLERSRPLLSEC